MSLLSPRGPAPAVVLAAACLAAVLAAGCGSSDTGAAETHGPTGAGPLRVVATTGMVADLARHVGGERVEVTTLMGPGVDPHLYKPTGGDARAILQADLVLYSGLKLEEGLFRSLEKRAADGEAVAAVTAGLSEETLLTPPGFSGHPDPHVWHDVALWARCLEAVADELSALRPAHAAEFRANAAAYRAELEALDDVVRAAIATIPTRRRVLVTAHDAFGYFSRAYGIPVRSVQGVTTESEAGVADVNQLAKFLADSGVPAIFAETSVSDRAVKAVVEGANRRGGNVKISPTPLHSDALGAADGPAADYAGMIAANVETIVRELGGTPPAGGLRPPAASDD